MFLILFPFQPGELNPTREVGQLSFFFLFSLINNQRDVINMQTTFPEGSSADGVHLRTSAVSSKQERMTVGALADAVILLAHKESNLVLE